MFGNYCFMVRAASHYFNFEIAIFCSIGRFFFEYESAALTITRYDLLDYDMTDFYGI